MAGTSDKVTIEQKSSRRTLPLRIEQDRRLVDLLFLQIEQGESVGLPDFDFNVVIMFDVEGWACDLFVLGPGHHQHPAETSSCGEEWSGDKVGVFPLT